MSKRVVAGTLMLLCQLLPTHAAAQPVEVVSRVHFPIAAANGLVGTPSATPTATPFPTATPRPSATPIPGPACRHTIGDPGFEADVHSPPWSVLGDVVVVESDEFATAFAGRKMARVWPDDDEEFDLLIHDVRPMPTGRVTSATARLHVMGRSLEVVSFADAFVAGLFHGDLSNCDVDCSFELTTEFNNTMSRTWRLHSVSAAEAFAKTHWPSWQLVIGARNDYSLSTWWFVDDISVEICERPSLEIPLEIVRPSDRAASSGNLSALETAVRMWQMSRR